MTNSIEMHCFGIMMSVLSIDSKVPHWTVFYVFYAICIAFSFPIIILAVVTGFVGQSWIKKLLTYLIAQLQWPLDAEVNSTFHQSEAAS